ncbi:Ubiquitin fusion degradation protein 4 [Sporothrix stenoceras]|uniref:Ubiquitin fusion degradation protein 4 n=1 Tax=Sporothrix stenoceras TaxID=5173 RepID=A0ABR3YHH0_9PEZI
MGLGTLRDGSSGVRPSLGAVKVVDPALARSLLLIKRFADAKKAIDESAECPAGKRDAAIEAITINGAHIEDLGLDFTLPGYPDIELIPQGCHVGVTMSNVETYVDKVVSMTLEGGVRLQVDAFRRALMDSVKADHGFNMDSRSVKNLLQVMSEMSPSERRDFLQFATGSPRLPIGGTFSHIFA